MPPFVRVGQVPCKNVMRIGSKHDTLYQKECGTYEEQAASVIRGVANMERNHYELIL